jgi:integrase
MLGIPGFHPHELRHTAASLAIASGADVKVVQQMLGHKSATMTLDQYGHFFGDRLDVVADAMDAAESARRCVTDVSGSGGGPIEMSQKAR